jgi:putative ABC transport system ATP-binding protein
MALLEAREVYRFYHSGDEEVKALRGVDVCIEPGEMVAFVGPSGSGKSTLLICLAGLDEPDGGEVFVLDERMTRREEKFKTELRSRAMGIMLQTNNLFAHLNVTQNVNLAQSVFGESDKDWAKGIVERLGIAARANARPAELSGGERARAALAVALARKPKILVLDEPTGEVDANAEAVILDVLHEHCTNGGAVVVATHNEALAKKASRILPIKDGKFVDVK